MMKISKYLVAAVLLTGFGTANAASEGLRKITQINNYKGHSGTLIKQEVMPSQTEVGCDRSDQFILDQNHRYYRENYTLILSAFMAGKPVEISYNQNECLEGFAKVTHVKIR